MNLQRAQIDDWQGAQRFRFDFPEGKNALDLPTVTALRDRLRDAPHQTFVLGSTTMHAFSAGADLKIDADTRALVSDMLYEIYGLIVQRPGPVVAVVEGVTVGGGAQLAAAADLRVIGPGARMKWVGAGHGLVVGAWILPALLGRSTAFDLMMSSRWLDAEAMVGVGLAAEVYADPWRQAEALVQHLSGLDAAAIGDLKAITAAPDLLAQLERERTRNATWDGAASMPS